ncbi:OmpA family protein [Helicobacter burdigaliensis]|uniref:OmpA family protein n=1 Tax=Helicobacter burdigaliensis TaxID=2315334 RepID=UPI000EF73CC8|nr:OmpA family protein [Helicobacter burdigaliensis]
MKKFLVLGSLAATLLITGCSQKSNVETAGSTTTQEPTYTTSGFNANRDNFVNIEERMQYIEGYLQNIFFDFDKFNIRADMQSAITTDAEIFNSVTMGSLNVRVEGNTDEWGTDEYNYALGLKRASAVKDALVQQGVSEAKMVLVSYGESKPTCNDKTKECWAENRKVTFKLLP